MARRMIGETPLDGGEVLAEFAALLHDVEELEGVVNARGNLAHLAVFEKLVVLALEHQGAARAAGDDGNALRLPSEDALGVLLRVFVRLVEVSRGDHGSAAADEGFVRDDLIAVLLHDVDEGAADFRLVFVDVAARIEDDLLLRRLLLHLGEDAVERIGREGGHIALACDADGGEDAERLADLHADVGACCAKGQGAHELCHALAVREHVVPL